MDTLLELDLQFFAKEGPGGEKTEEPTQKKLDDARKEGQVSKSKELSNAVALLGVFAIIRSWGGMLGNSFMEMFNWIYGNFGNFNLMSNGDVSMKGFTRLMNTVIIQMILMLLPVFAVGFAIAVVVDVVQVKWKVTGKPLQPKLSKLSPLKGVKRLFSMEKLMELAKSIARIALIAYIAWTQLQDKIGMLYLLYDYDVWGAVSLVSSMVVDLGIRISGAYLVLGLIDLLYQKRKFHKDMMMTKQEIKDEYKNTEGDPQIKGKIKQKMAEASRRRMMQAVPKADVVITNPTHFAVALKYDADVADAPIVTAKGADLLAKRIKEIAKENDIQIVENKPLARMLYHNVEVGAMVPPELYQAVAEVLAFVYNIKKQGKAG
ncbi:MAG: flagellar biosynthesis protein FlhB [Lachnospiraceae bacterium]|nr:flagellar biosynthesis protein FlhB [Lachnospiraceae bacterium]